MDRTSIFALAELRQATAHFILRDLNIFPLWKQAGGFCNLVGSLRTGLLIQHLDIDVHAYTPLLNTEISFAIMGRLARHPAVKAIQFSNRLHTEEECLEWHCLCEYPDATGKKQEWQLDCIHIRKGSLYDGHFERVADAILKQLTPERRMTILSLKYQTPGQDVIPGIVYCRAVLEDNVQTWNEFCQWRNEHRNIDLMHWIPG